MAPTRVAVIGAGLAGPVLALFLQKKGYDPVVYERLDSVVPSGLSIALQPNGLKVLSLLSDIVPNLPGHKFNKRIFYSQTSNEVLAEIDVSHLDERYGPGLAMIGVQRSAFHRLLCDTAEKHGIPIKWGHYLVDLEEVENDEVEVRFANGVKERASFVIGCDGLHSNTRVALFGPESPSFTGLVQTGGQSPTPDILKDKFVMFDHFGVNAHMIAYPISDSLYSWAVTSAEEEHKETWRSIDEERKEAFKSGPFSQWSYSAGDLVKTTSKVIKYGLYDRPELKIWHKGRVVLLGDAAHPTTPHLGQGANQAYEDVYHFIRTLIKFHPDPSTPPTTAELSEAFVEYESIREPRSASLVQGARKQGQLRVVDTLERARERDEIIREFWAKDQWSAYDIIAKGPFEGKSEI